MKTLYFFLLIALLFLPLPLPGHNGEYNTWSNLIYCEPAACIHEVGHKLDDLAGFGLAVSSSPEWRSMIDDLGGDDYIETYARMFAFAEGKQENMPVLLRPFYDWELAQELLKDYQ